jgi:hypothetical protein
MLVICPQDKYPYLPLNIRIYPQTSIEFNFRYLRSRLKEYMLKKQGKMVHMHKIAFQSN